MLLPRLAAGTRGSLGARPQRWRSMGQRTLDGFVTQGQRKRPRLDASADAQPVSTAAAAPQQQHADPAPVDTGAAAPPVAAVGAGPESSSGAAATNAEPQRSLAAGAGSAAPESGGEHVTQLQRLRAHANRNAALAKQVVISCEQAGALPALRNLLVEESWQQLLQGEFEKPYFQELQRFVQAEWGGSKMVFPPKDAVFRALNSCPVEAVKVVILGQDPYHDIGQAMGLSFSVPKGKAIPSSLRNIYKEIKEDVGATIPPHGNLEKWAQQGVLMLNAVLTVRAHQAGSHAKKGWEQFTEAAISKLSERRKGLVFLLWGRFAQDKVRVICNNKHHILTAAHPSGLSANRGFFGCRHFSQANALLSKEGAEPIDWQIDP